MEAEIYVIANSKEAEPAISVRKHRLIAEQVGEAGGIQKIVSCKFYVIYVGVWTSFVVASMKLWASA